ncbi:2-C-methyl-D-erythritol 2,4-cyclodiphosphate synthase [bacterium]|nr:2-C-methyl-D-erythritol 2,4-cyclodiphosphate synthase [bacterium]
MFRIGFGYDVHQLVEGRKLVLGGVTIPYPRGLAGHSDADVLVHAICDALLGACAAGDIGQHFPDTDGHWKDIASTLLLQRVVRIVQGKGYRIVNIDSLIIAQAPRIGPYRDAIRHTLCEVLSISPDCFNLKATTTEKLGFEGREEGIAAQAIALIRRYDPGTAERSGLEPESWSG